MIAQAKGKQRRSPFTDCRADAIEAANKRRGYSVCPYRKPPYRSVWLKQYDKTAQKEMPW